jgi:hypothetical protein
MDASVGVAEALAHAPFHQRGFHVLQHRQRYRIRIVAVEVIQDRNAAEKIDASLRSDQSTA